MNPSTRDPNRPPSGSGPDSDAAGAVDETLRLISMLPAPAGLEDRIHATLRSPHARRPGRVLAWPPSAQRDGGAWMRTAAAAAIAFVIAGGGWGVYLHVQSLRPAEAVAAPAHPADGGFSAAGAIRTPQTLNGPVVTTPAVAHPAHAHPVRSRPAKKHAASGPSAKGQPAAKTSATGPAVQ